MSENTTEFPGQGVEDSVLLERFVSGGDEAAFRIFVERYQRMVVAVAFRRTGDLEMARDVAQKVFVTVVRKAKSLVEHQRVAGWLYHASSHEAVRAVQAETRRKRREARSTERGSGPASTVVEPRWEALEDALGAMKTGDRELVVMRYFQDQTYPEIARKLGVSEPALRKRMSRALEGIGRRLASRGVGTPARPLLVGAVGVQAALPVSEGMAAGALALGMSSVVGAVSVPVFFSTLMTTSTTIKVIAAAAVLASIPIGLKWKGADPADVTGGGAVVGSIDMPKSGAAVNRPPVASEVGGTGQAAVTDETAVARDELLELRRELYDETQRAGAAQQALDVIGNEVVISMGNVDAIAANFADFVKLASGQDAPPPGDKIWLEKLADAAQIAEEVALLDDRPELHARYLASFMGEILGFDDGLREPVAQAFLPGMKAMVEEGLVYAHRPTEDTGTWDARYNERALAYVRAAEPLLPSELRQSDLWQEIVGGKMLEKFDRFVEWAHGVEAPFHAGSE